jgi:Carboxypeptidase regulatory-like domain
MNRVSIRLILLTLGLLGAFAVQGLAQEATIVGTVTDPSGAAVPNAPIELTNTDTGYVRHIKTNDLGQYVAPGLRFGNYIVRAEVTGFKAFEKKDLVLAVGDRVRVDIVLELGSEKQVVTVEATPVAVQTDTGEVSGVITGRQVTQLATNGRTVYSLAYLVPGAASNMPDFQSPTAVGANANVSFNGQRQNHNLWLMDGGEDSDRGGAGGIDVMPSMDAIAEFRVMSSNYSPEYGLSSAGTMHLVLRSGTSKLHANAWEFLRNEWMDALNPFTKAAGQAAPILRLNTYGFNVGGPISYKGKNQDKTFFFYNMEWRKLSQGQTRNQTVPLPSTYGGVFPSDTVINVPDFSKLAPSEQAKFTNLGLTSGQPFPNNMIPASLLDPNAQVLLQAGVFPAPTQANKYIGAVTAPTFVREELVRIDEHVSDKFSLFGHYVAEQTSQTYDLTLWSGSNVPTVGTTFGNPAYSAVVHATISISPTLMNEIAFNYNGNRINIVPAGVYARPSGLNIPELFPGNNDNRIPSIDLNGAVGAHYENASWPWHNRCDNYQIKDDISWVKGAHQLRFGASWQLYKKVQDLFGNTEGQFSFNGNYTGNDFADFLLGYSNNYNELAVQDAGHWNAPSWDAYIQDNWRVTNRLTLNLGLRWDGVPHTYEANNRMSNFYPNLYNPADAAILIGGGNAISPSSPGLGTSPNPLLAGIPFYLNGIGIAGKNGISNSLVQSQWWAFGPRLGFAYDLSGNGKTILRGGFGTMYERIQGNDMYNAGPNQPFSTVVSFDNVSLSNPNTSVLTGLTQTAPITVGSLQTLSYSDYKLPVVYQYSVGIQRQLAADSVLSVTYVGNQSRHQNDYRQINLPPLSALPGLINGTTVLNTVVQYLGFHDIRQSENAMNAHYNGLQVELKSRVKRDLTLSAAYTWSRSIDPSTAFGGDMTNVTNPYDRAYDYGPSAADRTHIGIVSFVYDIPTFRNASNRAVKVGLGGWQISGIGLMQTGLPLNITVSGPQGANGLPNAGNRPDFSGSVEYTSNVNNWFSATGFSLPTKGEWGTLPKGEVRGPGRQNWNLSLFKNFTISETRGSGIELRIESFNTWNHTQFNGISTGASFASDGKTINNDFGRVNSMWDPRVFQVGVKVKF